VLGIIIEEVATLIACDVERSGEDSGDCAVKELVFTLTIYTLLMGNTVIITVNDVAYA